MEKKPRSVLPAQAWVHPDGSHDRVRRSPSVPADPSGIAGVDAAIDRMDSRLRGQDRPSDSGRRGNDVGVILVALRTTLVTLVLTGMAYPLVITAISQALLSHRANGSLVIDDSGQIVGSALIGQRFSHPAYVWSRPSAAGANGYDATASSGSNLGPTSQKLRDRIVAEVARLTEANPDASGAVPVELVTTSASGLDPHLSPSAALWQVPRVARARGVAPERVRQVVAAQTEGRDLGMLGEPRVNVLLLNLALDHQFGRPPAAQ